jgi:cell wall integrity and stress response component
MPTGAISSTDNEKSQSKKISSGSVAGIAVGVVIAAIVLLAAIIIGFCCWRRRKNVKDDGEGGLNRNPSVLSRKILLGGGSRGTNGAPYAANSPDMQEKRSSKPLGIDQRLNPNAFMQHDDGSHSSFVSMQDNRDYTRTLNVRQNH